MIHNSGHFGPPLPFWAPWPPALPGLPMASHAAGSRGGSVDEWLACWTQAQKGPGSNRSHDAVGFNSLRQTVHTHLASVHQAAKLVAALLRVAGVTAGLAESNGSLPPGL